MNRFISRHFVGVLGLLCSSVGTAATITVTASTLAPAINDTFTMSLAGDLDNAFAASIEMSWDPTKVAYVSGTGLGSFTVYVKNSPDAETPTSFYIEVPAGSVSGQQDYAELTFQALAAGAANFDFFDDDGGNSGWPDFITSAPIVADYVVDNVVVAGGAAEPDITVDLLAVDFGSVTVGSTATQDVTVTNDGTSDLAIGAITSPAAPFSLNPDLCSSQTLAAGESCVITVNYEPVDPPQADNADLVIPSDDPDENPVTVTLAGTGTATPVPDITVTPSSVDFGNVEVATSQQQTVTVANDGTADLTIGTVGPVAAPFSIVTDNCGGQTLTPASSCTIDLAFTPLAEGAAADSLDIASDDPDEATVTVTLDGNGTPPVPVASVTDSVAPADDLLIPFGNVTIGGVSPAETVTVTNSGTADLVIGAIAGGNPLAAEFVISNDTCSGQTVTPLNSCTLNVEFQPTAVQAYTDGFDIPSNAAGSPITFNVSGTGAPVPVPDITVTPASVAFGNVSLGNTPSSTITVTNDGSADLTITGVTAPALPFSITADTCDGQTLAPTDTCTITVQFAPDAAQVYNDNVSISSDDPDEDTVVVALSGTGSAAPVGEIVIDGGSSAVDPWSLAFLGGLPFLRRRRKAAARVAAKVLAVAATAGILAAPAAMAADDGWDWDYDGFYVGAGVIGTSLQTSSDLNTAISTELDATGSFEDFAYGGQIYAGWMFNNIFGIEGRWSDSGDGSSDILFVESGGSRTDIGDIDIGLDGWTIYGVANWPVAERWDLFGKLGYTDQNADLDATVDSESFSGSDDDSGVAAALGARWRFARHWATTVEGEYLGVDFDSALDEPWRVGLNIEYWFGGNEMAPPPAPPPPPAKVAAAPPPPPPPPPAPKDSDGDGVVDGMDKCADTPRGDKVDTAGCSCDVTRQLTFRTNSAELSDADMLVLDEMAANLTRLNFVSGVIEGHTDSTGAESYNQGLSERRAQSVADYLASKGISRDRLQVVGRGESEPIGDNKTADGRALNRRVVARRTDCGN